MSNFVSLTDDVIEFNKLASHIDRWGEDPCLRSIINYMDEYGVDSLINESAIRGHLKKQGMELVSEEWMNYIDWSMYADDCISNLELVQFNGVTFYHV